MVRIGVIGGGYGRLAHLPGLAAQDGVAVVALADGGSGRLAAAAPEAPYFPSWQALLDRAEIDAVSVAAPPTLHAPIVLAALRRGLHVLCEKPFGRDAAEAEAMLAALPAGRVGAVGFQFRYESGLQALRGVLMAGRIGRLRRIAITWTTSGRADPRRPWGFQHDADAGGGVIESFLSHCLDYVTWLSGERACRVFARSDILVAHRSDAAGTPRAVTAEDSVDAILELTGGAVVTACVGNCQPGCNMHRIELAGDAGWAELDQQLPAGPQRLTVRGLAGTAPSTLELPPWPSDADSRLPAFARLARDFVAAIGGDAPPALPRFADGAAVRRLIAVIGVSRRQGCWAECDQPVGNSA